jgi:serine O-acetyltransferase
MLTQAKYFRKDLNNILGHNKLRILIIWFSPVFIGLLFYRIERSLFLIFGQLYSILRLPFTPIIFLINSYTNFDIHYKADIKGGLYILHNSVGVVISGQTIAGVNLCLTGGNVIGAKSKGEIKIGNNCYLGANATIIGPLELGNSISIGASACVIQSYKKDNCILVGVPAKEKGPKF